MSGASSAAAIVISSDEGGDADVGAEAVADGAETGGAGNAPARGKRKAPPKRKRKRSRRAGASFPRSLCVAQEEPSEEATELASKLGVQELRKELRQYGIPPQGKKVLMAASLVRARRASAVLDAQSTGARGGAMPSRFDTERAGRAAGGRAAACRLCAAPVPAPRRTFCTDECAHFHMLRTSGGCAPTPPAPHPLVVAAMRTRRRNARVAAQVRAPRADCTRRRRLRSLRHRRAIALPEGQQRRHRRCQGWPNFSERGRGARGGNGGAARGDGGRAVRGVCAPLWRGAG